MRDPIAQVQPAVDLAKLSHQWDLLEAREQRTLAEIRLAKGKLLREARKGFPDTGRGAGWVEHLAKWKIDERTARRYMDLAEYVEKNPDKVSELLPPPTYAEAGIVTNGKTLAPVYDLSLPRERSRPATGIVSATVLESDTERLIAEGVPPREAALQVIQDSPTDWTAELEHLGLSMVRAAKSLFANAEALDVMCRQKHVVVSSPIFMSLPSMLIAAKTSIQNTLTIVGNGVE